MLQVSICVPVCAGQHEMSAICQRPLLVSCQSLEQWLADTIFWQAYAARSTALHTSSKTPIKSCDGPDKARRQNTLMGEAADQQQQACIHLFDRESHT